MWFDATTAGPSGFFGLIIQNVMIGESGNAHSLVLDGLATQGNRIQNNEIWGGIYLKQVADSNLILYNRISGNSVFGVDIDCSSGGSVTAGQCMFVGNSMTASGGLQIDGGSWVTVAHNYFEEVTLVSFPRNAFIDVRDNSSSIVTGVQIYENIIANIVSTTSLGILIGTNGSGNVPTNTYISNNLIANLNGRVAVNNFGTGTTCGVNTWQSNATHVGGTGTLKNAIGSVVVDCP